MESKESFIIEDIDKFKVVRDDLFEGGTKRRAFSRLIDQIPEHELVYAVDYYGAAAYAIALTALDAGKDVMLFYLSPACKRKSHHISVMTPRELETAII